MARQPHTSQMALDHVSFHTKSVHTLLCVCVCVLSGAFGCVYKGILTRVTDEGIEEIGVAIKTIKSELTSLFA